VDNDAEITANAALAFVYENALVLAAGLATLSVLLFGLSIYLVIRRNGVLTEAQRRRQTHLNAEPVSQR
jgi:hypothetical protein